MTAVNQILQVFDDAWSHKWESLASVLDGVTEAEACWQADAYAAEAPEAGWPLPGTIAWQVAHVAHCKRHYTDVIRARAESEAPAVEPRRPLSSFAEERAALEVAHTAQREAIASVPDADLPAVACGKMPLGEFLVMATRHDTWHAAQIAVVRRLYRASQPATTA